MPNNKNCPGLQLSREEFVEVVFFIFGAALTGAFYFDGNRQLPKTLGWMDNSVGENEGIGDKILLAALVAMYGLYMYQVVRSNCNQSRQVKRAAATKRAIAISATTAAYKQFGNIWSIRNVFQMPDSLAGWLSSGFLSALGGYGQFVQQAVPPAQLAQQSVGWAKKLLAYVMPLFYTVYNTSSYLNDILLELYKSGVLVSSVGFIFDNLISSLEAGNLEILKQFIPLVVILLLSLIPLGSSYRSTSNQFFQFYGGDRKKFIQMIIPGLVTLFKGNGSLQKTIVLAQTFLAIDLTSPWKLAAFLAGYGINMGAQFPGLAAAPPVPAIRDVESAALLPDVPSPINNSRNDRMADID